MFKCVVVRYGDGVSKVCLCVVQGNLSRCGVFVGWWVEVDAGFVAVVRECLGRDVYVCVLGCVQQVWMTECCEENSSLLCRV